jgi:hypothetical protein
LEYSSHCHYRGPKYLAEDARLPDRDRAGRLWKEMQVDATYMSSRGEQVFAVKSGHFVQYDEPNVVVGQVRRLLDEIALPNGIKQAKSNNAAAKSPDSM